MKKRLSVAFGIASMTVASTAALANQNVPQTWIQFAEHTSHQLEEQLAQEESDSVQRLHAGLTKRYASAGNNVENSLVVRIWMDGEGRVLRVSFGTLGDAQLDQDLFAILAEKPLPHPPPDMPQPLVLKLRLDLKA